MSLWTKVKKLINHSCPKQHSLPVFVYVLYYNCDWDLYGLWLYNNSCMYLCVAIMRTQQKSYTATKKADSSGHCLHCSVFILLYTALQLWVTLPTDHPGVSLLTNILRPSFGLTGFHGNSSSYGLHAEIHKERSSSSGHSSATSKMPEIRSLFGHPSMNTHRDPSIYIYIYIYTHINAHYHVTPWASSIMDGITT